VKDLVIFLPKINASDLIKCLTLHADSIKVGVFLRDHCENKVLPQE